MDQTLDPYIPPQAYFYFPPKSEIKGKGHRAIFNGSVEFEESETELIQQFKIYAQKHHYTLESMWTDNEILRFLQANGYKMEKTLHSVKGHTTWTTSLLTFKPTDKIKEFLNTGFLYVHGRDHKFRPVVVFNIYRLDAKAVDFSLLTDALTYGLTYILNELMLPGQVENWIFLSNAKGMGIAQVAVQGVRKFFGYLQDHFKCRLYRMYILNVSAGIYIPWQIIKKFLDGDTVDKVQFYKNMTPDNLFTHTNREQVEEQFGGSAPNCTDQYWPPRMPSSNYFISEKDNEDLITHEKYLQLHKDGKLPNHRINQSIVAPPAKKTEQHNNKVMEPTSDDHTTPGNQSCSFLPDEETDYLEYMSENLLANLNLRGSHQFRNSFV